VTRSHASPGARIAAGIIDALIVLGIPVVLLLIAMAMFVLDFSGTTDANGTVTSSGIGGGASAAAIGCYIGAALLAVVLAVYLGLRQRRTGQTPGKKVLHIGDRRG